MEETTKLITEDGEKKESLTPPPANNPIQNPALKTTDEIIDMKDFDFTNYQVVRREFFAHQGEPSLISSNSMQMQHVLNVSLMRNTLKF